MKRTTTITLLCVLLSWTGFSQGKLEKAKKGLSQKSTIFSSTRTNPRSTNNSYGHDYGLFGELAIVFIEIGLYATYYGLIESPPEQEYLASKGFITKYPYHTNHKGNYAYDWNEDTNLSRITISNRFITENNKLYGNHINADFRFFRRLSLEADYLQLWEHTTFFGNSSLATATFLLKYHRVRTEKFNAYWGLGATYIDGDVHEVGFTYGIGAEYFFARPISLELNYNQTLINIRSFDKLNVLLNYHKNRFKGIGGYEYLSIGGVGFSTFSIGLGVFL